jgi:hypothetical protein
MVYGLWTTDCTCFQAFETRGAMILKKLSVLQHYLQFSFTLSHHSQRLSHHSRSPTMLIRVHFADSFACFCLCSGRLFPRLPAPYQLGLFLAFPLCVLWLIWLAFGLRLFEHCRKSYVKGNHINASLESNR